MIGKLIIFFYLSALFLLAIYGLHRYYLLYLYNKYRCKGITSPIKDSIKYFPIVTVQLPLYNEKFVVERLINAVCYIDYPKDRLEIQVLDDSNDETSSIARSLVEKYKKEGFDIVYIHRNNRDGFKAGALQNGLKTCKGEFVAIFDADFVPHSDFLKRTLPYFADDKIGMIQARWTHLNSDYSLLTKIQSFFIDGHFIIEHTARNRSSKFFNFNGTAGIWRKKCIEAAGGWQSDTLTEDMDLSYRAQLEGWKFLFLPEIESPAELPMDINAFKSQQSRWAKGTIQTAKKLIPKIIKSDLPFSVKSEAIFHLTSNFAYICFIILAITIYPAMKIRPLNQMLYIDLPIFLIGSSSISSFYICSQKVLGRKWFSFVKYLPFLMTTGVGLSVANSKAVLEAICDLRSDFQRTPKRGSTTSNMPFNYKPSKNIVPLIELILGVYLIFVLKYAFEREIYIAIPFIFIFLMGYLFISLMSFYQYYRKIQ